MGRAIAVALAVLSGTGCAVKDSNPDLVPTRIQTLSGHSLRPDAAAPLAFTLPPDVSLADGILSEEEAVAIALWNNASFQASLTDLGFARADLAEAGLLRNPVLSLLFPWGPKQLEATLVVPVDFLWQRPRRVATARAGLERVGESLVVSGLRLVRETRTAAAEVTLAEERLRLADETMSLANELQTIAAARLRAGDISELESDVARLEALRSADEKSRRLAEVSQSRSRLRALLGMPLEEPEFDVEATAVSLDPMRPLSELLSNALVSRPDLRAAELGIEEAALKAGWESSRIWNLGAVVDLNGEGREGTEVGPGIATDIPLLSQNQGGRMRAEAEVERAARQYQVVRQRITLETEEARSRYEAARESYSVYAREIVPSWERAVDRAQRAYSAGEESYLFVLETTRSLVDARLRRVEAEAELRRAKALLQEVTGIKL